MYTTDEFVDKVTLYGSIPDGRYTSEEIIGVAFDQLLSTVMPLIISLNEEYYVRSEYQTVTASQASYDIPYRALGMALREAKLVVLQEIRDLNRISPEEITTSKTGEPTCFYLEALAVILYPTPNTTTGQLKQSYFLTPSQPVLVADAAQITAIDRVTGIVTAVTPSTWTTSNTFDLITARNGHDSKAMDLVATAVSAASMTFAVADLPTSIGVGDYIALAGQAPYLQCPDLCYRYLIQLTVNELLMSMGSQAELQAGMAKAGQLMTDITKVLSSRVVGAPKPFTIDSSLWR